MLDWTYQQTGGAAMTERLYEIRASQMIGREVKTVSFYIWALNQYLAEGVARRFLRDTASLIVLPAILRQQQAIPMATDSGC
jgi:hypothetical protein